MTLLALREERWCPLLVCQSLSPCLRSEIIWLPRLCIYSHSSLVLGHDKMQLLTLVLYLEQK